MGRCVNNGYNGNGGVRYNAIWDTLILMGRVLYINVMREISDLYEYYYNEYMMINITNINKIINRAIERHHLHFYSLHRCAEN